MISTYSLKLNVIKTDPQQEKFVCEKFRAHYRMYAIPCLSVYPQNCFAALMSKYFQNLRQETIKTINFIFL